MADITISITIPDVYVADTKAALEHHAKKYGGLAEGGTFTNNQAIVYGKKQIEKLLRSIIKEYKQDTKVSIAEAEAMTETNVITFT